MLKSHFRVFVFMFVCVSGGVQATTDGEGSEVQSIYQPEFYTDDELARMKADIAINSIPPGSKISFRGSFFINKDFECSNSVMGGGSVNFCSVCRDLNDSNKREPLNVIKGGELVSVQERPNNGDLLIFKNPEGDQFTLRCEMRNLGGFMEAIDGKAHFTMKKVKEVELKQKPSRSKKGPGRAISNVKSNEDTKEGK